MGQDKESKQKQIDKQMQRGCDLVGKQESNTEWKKTEKGSGNKQTSRYRVGARWMGSHRARQIGISQRKEAETNRRAGPE
jgi:hypothetical protein